MMIYLHLMQLEFGVTKAISHRLYYIETPFSERKKIEGKNDALPNHHPNEKQTFTRSMPFNQQKLTIHFLFFH